MKVLPVSDLHLEFDYFDASNFMRCGDMSDVVLILAGDIHVKYKAARQLFGRNGEVLPSWLALLSRIFRAIVYIPGNHEHYGSSIDKTIEDINDQITSQGLNNIHVLNNETVIFDDVRILGTTLWTDFNNRDPLVMWDAKRSMNDYNHIRKNDYGSRITPDDILREHEYALSFLKRELSSDFSGKNVVVSHHAPSFQSIHPNYRAHTMTNGAYASSLENFILDSDNISLWVHGHMHNSFDYMIGDCRVVCNPRGYAGYCEGSENTEFNPCLIITI